VSAVSATTGRTLWSTPIPVADAAISAPVAVSAGGRYVIVTTDNGDLIAINGTTGAIVWHELIGHGINLGGPAIGSGIGYMATGITATDRGGFKLVAFQVSNGRILWSRDCGFTVQVTPTVGNGIVYIGENDEQMHAFNARTGAVLWSADTFRVLSQAALANGVLYSATDVALTATDAATGKLLFRSYISFGAPNLSSPAVSNGWVFVGSAEGVVRAFALS
jgi:eukaryotic-like serine/threonine-protein kinase